MVSLIKLSVLLMFRGTLFRYLEILLGMLYLALSSLNWRHSNRRCLMEILDPQVLHDSGSVLSIKCLWVCQECPILKRVRITSCSLANTHNNTT